MTNDLIAGLAMGLLFFGLFLLFIGVLLQFVTKVISEDTWKLTLEEVTHYFIPIITLFTALLGLFGVNTRKMHDATITPASWLSLAGLVMLSLGVGLLIVF
jgi:protein-S-isoprenylcysteine O-methyltransferase Ste14